ncbi:hypothetical protein ABPG74_022561 [Tetrahymena malaccensis]
MFLACGSTFLVVFFVIFHPTASLEFKQVQNCQIIGQLSNLIANTEKYSILYINFEYEGDQYLGQACTSNLYETDFKKPVFSYKFYYKFDEIVIDKSIILIIQIQTLTNFIQNKKHLKQNISGVKLKQLVGYARIGALIQVNFQTNNRVMLIFLMEKKQFKMANQDLQ